MWEQDEWKERGMRGEKDKNEEWLGFLCIRCLHKMVPLCDDVADIQKIII